MIKLRTGRFVPFTYKLMFIFLTLLLLTDALIGYYAYRSSISSMKQTYSINLTRILEQVRDNTMHQINDYRKTSDQLYNDIKLQRLLQSKEDSYRIYELSESYLWPTLDSALDLPVNDVMISLYLNNQEFGEVYGSYEEDENPFLKLSAYNIYYMNRLEVKEWFQEWKRKQRHDEWAQIDSDSEYHNITLIRKLISFDNFGEIGYLLVKARLEDMFKSVDSFELQEGANLLVMNLEDQSVLYSRLPVHSESFDLAEADKDHLVLEEVLTGTGWKLAATLPDANLRKDADKIKQITILICLASFAVAAAIGFVISRYFSNRVRRIVNMARSFHDGEFKQRVVFEGISEFAYISSALNKMADNIEALIKEVYQRTIQKKEAELTALQAQINPHFLYNTLSSIRSMAKLDEVDKLSEMVDRLAQFYRLTLNNGRTVIPIAKEVEQVMMYASIQQIKYVNRFSILADMKPDVMGYDTVKLILQPFVENALKHAWYEGHMTIRIRGRLEQASVLLQVIDDGVGFDPQVLAEKNHARTGGYGIRNVDERIKLQFGSEYGVSIYSKPGLGTTVTIRIPAYREKAN